MAEIKHLTRAELTAQIRNAPTGAKFAIHVMQDAPIAGEPGRIFQNGLRTHISLSRKVALRIAGEYLSETLEKRGARIPFHIYESKGHICYWIGG